VARRKREEKLLPAINLKTLEQDIIAYSSEFQFKYLNEKIFKKWTLLDKHVFAAFLTCIDWQGTNPSVIEVDNEYIAKRLGWNFSKGQETRVGTYLRECFLHISEHSVVNLYDYYEKAWFMEPLILHASGNATTTKVVFNPHFMSHFERLYERAELNNKGFTMFLASDVISMKTIHGLRAEERLRSFHKKNGIATYKYVFTTMETKDLMGLEKGDYMRVKISETEYKDFNRNEFERSCLKKALEDINENSILVRILKNKDSSLFKKIKNGRTVVGYEIRWQVAAVDSAKEIVQKKLDAQTKELNTKKVNSILPKEVEEIYEDYSDWIDIK
jgi:hypothetical protein